MSFRSKWRRTLVFPAFLASTGLGTVPARAADLELSLECPRWTAEAASQIEARVRTTLLAEPLPVRGVLSCREPPFVELWTSRGQAHVAVTPLGGPEEDDFVAAVERALRQLQSPQPSPPVEPPAPLPAPPPAPVVVVKPATTPPVGLPAPTKTPAVVDVEARAVLERWSPVWALGAEAGLSAGNPTFGYGIAVGTRLGLNEPPTFELTEWNVALRARLSPPKALGLRGTLAVGASLLTVAPSADVLTRTNGFVGSAFAELSVARPFWFGSLGVSPTVGARLFFGVRRVRLNEDVQATLPYLAPQAALLLLYRID